MDDLGKPYMWILRIGSGEFPDPSSAWLKTEDFSGFQSGVLLSYAHMASTTHTGPVRTCWKRRLVPLNFSKLENSRTYQNPLEICVLSGKALKLLGLFRLNFHEPTPNLNHTLPHLVAFRTVGHPTVQGSPWDGGPQAV